VASLQSCLKGDVHVSQYKFSASTSGT